MISAQLHVQIEVFETDAAAFLTEKRQRAVGNDVVAIALNHYARFNVQAATGRHRDVVNEDVRAVDQAPCATDFTRNLADARGNQVNHQFRLVGVVAEDGQCFVAAACKNGGVGHHQIVALTFCNRQFRFLHRVLVVAEVEA